MIPIRFLSWILGVIFTLGLADSFAHLTYKMGQAAIHAHQHDQMSYAKFNNLLWKQVVLITFQNYLSQLY